MRLDVALLPGEISPKDTAQSTVVVIDVLRATSSIATALWAGCEEVIPAESIEEAVSISKGYERADYLLCGERRGNKVDGFDLGNSPLEYSSQVVAGKKVILTTTNGTRALKEHGSVKEMFTASFLNAGAVMDALASRDGNIAIICSGQDRRFCMEDALCAGLIASTLYEDFGAELTDSAKAAASLFQSKRGSILDELLRSDHGSYLCSIGYEADVARCAEISVLDVVPKVFDRRVIRKGI